MSISYRSFPELRKYASVFKQFTLKMLFNWPVHCHRPGCTHNDNNAKLTDSNNLFSHPSWAQTVTRPTIKINGVSIIEYKFWQKFIFEGFIKFIAVWRFLWRGVKVVLLRRRAIFTQMRIFYLHWTCAIWKIQSQQNFCE